MKTKACPDAKTLGLLLLGKLPGPESESLEEHLLHCDNCAAMADTISASDELTAAILAPDIDYGEEEAVAQVIERGKQLRCRDETTETDETQHLENRPQAAGAPDAALENPENTAEEDEEIDFLAPPEQPDEIGRLGEYRVFEVLGVGGMGVVFRAEDPKLKRQVALKAMKPLVAASKSAKNRFLREAQATASIDHDNIVHIYQVGEDRGVPFIAMQFLRGESLLARLKREKKLDQREVLRIGREVAAGLAAAHDRQLIHRDIKPDNIWIEAGTGRAKILDFGLVRAAGNGNGNDIDLTQSGMVVGTPKYMAPEQAQGESVDHRCDLFSLGSMLYHLATGKAPFSGANVTATLMAVVQKEPKAVEKIAPEIDPKLARLIMQLLQKNPDDRPASAAEVLQRIADIERQPVTVVIPQATANDAPTIARKAAAEPNSEHRLRVGGPRLYFTVALLFLPLFYLFGGTILRFATNQGLLVVKVDDPNVEIVIKQNGVTVQDKTTGREFQLQAVGGEIEVYDRAGNVRLLTEKFTLTRGGKAYVAVTLEDLAKAKRNPPQTPTTGSKPWQPTPEQQAFREAVAKLTPQRQVEAVRERLQLRNPGFDGKLRHVIEKGRVVELQFLTDQVTDLSPVGALPHLERLICSGSSPDKGRLADLSPLQGMKLTYLDCSYTQVADLSPLQGVLLKQLNCSYTQVSDLLPLQGMKLTRLYCGGTQVADLTPLQGMPLTTLYCYDTQVADLTPLQGMKLMHLSCHVTQVADLSPLQGMPLTYLNCGGTQVSDLSPLQGMPLTMLHCYHTQVSDLTPLQGLPLTTLSWDARLYHPADETLLKSLPLKMTQVYHPFGRGAPVAEFWKLLAARRQAVGEFAASAAELPAEKQVEAVRSRLLELAPQNALVVLGVKTSGATVTEATLHLDILPHDLTPLMAFKGLKKLTLIGGADWLDLSPLTQLPLETLTCPEHMARKNAPVLKAIKTLKTINGRLTPTTGPKP